MNTAEPFELGGTLRHLASAACNARCLRVRQERKESEGDPVPEGLVWPYFKLMDTVMKDIDGTLSVLMPSPQPRVQFLQPRYAIPSIQGTVDGETLVETGSLHVTAQRDCACIVRRNRCRNLPFPFPSATITCDVA